MTDPEFGGRRAGDDVHRIGVTNVTAAPLGTGHAPGKIFKK